MPIRIESKTLYIPSEGSMADFLFDYDSLYINECKKQVLAIDISGLGAVIAHQGTDLTSCLKQLSVERIKDIYRHHDADRPRSRKKADLIGPLVQVIQTGLLRALEIGEQSLYDFLLLFPQKSVWGGRDLLDWQGWFSYAIKAGIIFRLKSDQGYTFICPDDLVSLIRESYAKADKSELKKRTDFARMAHNLIETVGLMPLDEYMLYLSRLLKFYEKGLWQQEVDLDHFVLEEEVAGLEKAISYLAGFQLYNTNMQLNIPELGKEALVFHRYVMDPVALFYEQEGDADRTYPKLSCRELLRPQSQNALTLARLAQDLADVGHLSAAAGEMEARCWFVAMQNNLVARDYFAEIVDGQEYTEQGQREKTGQLYFDFQLDLQLWWLNGRIVMQDLRENLDFTPDGEDELLAVREFFKELAIDPAEVEKIRATIPEPAAAWSRVGRNDPCPCGSGKKYKRCCGAR